MNFFGLGPKEAPGAERSPHLSPVQLAASNRTGLPPVPAVCAVTGGTGFVGARLVEMLIERGAKLVRCLDIVPPPADAWQHPRIEYIVGDICNKDALAKLVAGADCVWHNAAAVGPFHPYELYFKVNYEGTLAVIRACKEAGVRKIVMSSSPSTRFDGSDIDGLTEAEMPPLPQQRYLQTYAETKAMGEKALTDACCDELMTCAVAPHQVYGPRDNLFLPNMLEAAGTGRLRIFGPGTNRICFTHVDNYAHGLIIAERALRPGSAALGQFYIVTDGATHPHPDGYLNFWDTIDEAAVAMGFVSLKSKFHLPIWLLTILAYVCEAVGYLLGITLKLNLFNVRVLTMHRWFDISAAEKDLGYKPVVDFKEGWADTLVWFRANWLPKFDANAGLTGLSKQTQAKIDVQAGKAGGPEKAKEE